jgi:hypothetical protein
MSRLPRLTTLHADFNDFVEDGRLAVLLRPVLGHALPIVGQTVELRDSDGNSSQGRIESIDGRVAYVLVDWDTWVPSPPGYHQEPQGWWTITNTNEAPIRGGSRGVSEVVIVRTSGRIEDLEDFGRTGNSADAPSPTPR